MPTRLSLPLAALAALVLAACVGDTDTDIDPGPQTSTELTSPDVQALAQPAPDTVRVRFETSKGPFVIAAYRDWSPNGVDRFYHLARLGYFDGVRFFRVLSGFMAQFGLHGDPAVNAVWNDRSIPDDPVTHSNTVWV